MMPSNDTDYKSLFSQLIKKQMLVLGPDITLAKVKNVTGVTVDLNGDVQKIEGDPQKLLQELINQFVELSGMIVKKTMESILTSYPGMMGLTTGSMAAATGTPTPVPSPTPVAADAVPLGSGGPQAPTVPQASVNASQEPPSMASVELESLKMPSAAPSSTSQTPEPPTFSSNEMADLNKALEDLAKAPLSTENQNTTQGS